MPRFVIRRDAEPVPESPEQLFRLLRPKDPNVSFLWSHQADILHDESIHAGATQQPQVFLRVVQRVLRNGHRLSIK